MLRKAETQSHTVGSRHDQGDAKTRTGCNALSCRGARRERVGGNRDTPGDLDRQIGALPDGEGGRTGEDEESDGEWSEASHVDGSSLH